MQLEIPASLASDNALLFGRPERAGARLPAAPEVDEAPGDATLRLLTTCVEAMGLIQTRMDDLEAGIRTRLPARRPDAAADAVIATLQEKMAGIETRLGGWLEAGVQNSAAVRADFLALLDRVESMDTAVSGRVDAGARAAAAVRADLVALQDRVEGNDAAMRSRLEAGAQDAEDSRARFISLQDKVEGLDTAVHARLDAGAQAADAVRADFAALQGRVEGVATTVRNRLEAGAQAADAVRADFATLQDRVEKIDINVRGRLEAGAQDADAVRADFSALQGRVEGMAATVSSRLEAGSRELAGVGGALAAVQSAAAEREGRLDDAESRMARLEVRAQEFAARHADDVAAARTEAANWRMRTETDAMAFEQLSARLSTIEQGLTAKLDEATETLAEREEENARLKTESRIVESASDRLRSRILTLDSTIADQRARISCLQNKLATATYAIRFEHMSRTMAAAGDNDILDLATLASESLVSAA